MKYTHWVSGDWNAICDQCGRKFKASQLVAQWDGLMVCRPCWDPRHPQELLRPVKDQQKLPWTRPDGEDQFVEPTCTSLGRQAIAGYAVAGCAITSLNLDITEV